MSDAMGDNDELTPREELASIAASLRAYLKWQVDCGSGGIPRKPRSSTRGVAPSPAATVARAEDAASPSPSTRGVAPSPAATVARAEDAASPSPSTRGAAPSPAATVARAEDAASPSPSTRGVAPSPAATVARAEDAASPSPSALFEAMAPPVVVPPLEVATAVAPESRASAKKSLPPPPVVILNPRELPVIQAEVASCQKCALGATRKNTVFSRGNPDAKLMFIGEAPGADEDAQGKPFVGVAGQLLDKMIQAMGLDPEKDVYIANIIKCRPPGNRKPEPVEMETCIPYLHEQIAKVDPKAIVALGNTAVAGLLGAKVGITKMRGQWKLYQGKIPVMPTYHPSYLLRQETSQVEAKRQVWEDLQTVMKELGLEKKPRA